MATHMSIRLAWHNNGWNGHICDKPCDNVYCVGRNSYPGELIAETRNLDFEDKHAGEPISKHPCKIACGLSANAFGKENIQVKVDPPSWWDKSSAQATILNLEPYTACTWCYESMYNADVYTANGTYDYDKRRANAESYFEQFEEGKSLIFYYSGYSNPFSENEQDEYVIVGVSRIKKIGDYHFYENTTAEIKSKYAGGMVWQKPITSTYPDEGMVIPYWKYKDKEDVLNRIVIKPLHKSPFKYGSREVSNDDAIEIINQFISVVDTLIEIGDDTENWETRKKWLNEALNELWKSRGPYPGFPSALINMGLNSLVKSYISLSDESKMKCFRDEVKKMFDGEQDTVFGIIINNLKDIRREFILRDKEERELLLNVLPRFDLSKEQMGYILAEERENVSITASLKEILENPYIIFEQYQGFEPDDCIPFYRIDNGIIPSPEYGVDNIFDSGATERLRALCVDELNRIAAHSFGKAETIIKSLNYRLARMPEWKRYSFKVNHFKLDKEIFKKALELRKEDNGELYLYLRDVYDDEREIETIFRMLASRSDISLKLPISVNQFKKDLNNPNSKLYDNDDTTEQYENILDTQADVCMKIFNKPLCVLSGAAGTGKTTVIRAIVNNIERVHGAAAGFLLMAPTGKAAERIKSQTEKKSSTIHSFLASNGWLNENFTLKRRGGKKGQDVNTIIIDECSMIDLNLFATLLRSINWNSVQRLILVGDPNQLPPIGRGKVFSDTIQWLNEEYPDNVGKLTENIRQLVNRVEKNGCGILDLAELYVQEKQANMEDEQISIKLKNKKETLVSKIMEKANDNVDNDLAVYFWKGQEDFIDVFNNVLVKDMEEITGMTEYDRKDKLWQEAIRNEDKSANPDNIQIISPYKGEFYGTVALNSLMQKSFNGYWSNKYKLDGISFFDKVIQFRNRTKSDPAYAYNHSTKKIEQHEVFNGEIGITFIHPFDNKRYKFMSKIDRMQVGYSGKNRSSLRYNYGCGYGKNSKGWNLPEQKVADNIELAYAISVHKSQGSEFNYVYIVIPKRDSHLLSMELLYTAITRAQKKVTLFIQDDIGTLTSLGHLEKSAVKRINSSVFEFNPLPEEMLYIQNWYSDERKLATLSEYFVRSKSEVIIANMLVNEDVPFEYEKPLYAPDGTMYLPDFTVKFRGEEYYWEHVGMLDVPSYKAHWEKKLEWYNKHFKGKLLLTYEGSDLSLKAKGIIDENR